ncbi:hypothetical protein GCM10022245_01000 [Streptomyces mayteni]
MSAEKKAGLDALLTPEESVLVLIDHQPFQFANLNSHEPMIVDNVIGLAKAAKASDGEHAPDDLDSGSACLTPTNWPPVSWRLH